MPERRHVMGVPAPAVCHGAPSAGGEPRPRPGTGGPARYTYHSDVTAPHAVQAWGALAPHPRYAPHAPECGGPAGVGGAARRASLGVYVGAGGNPPPGGVPL